MSATMEVSAICNYWRRAPPGSRAGTSAGPTSAAKVAKFRIEGRAHPVQVLFAKRPHADYVSAALALTLELHRSRAPEYSLMHVLIYGTTEQLLESSPQH